MAGVALEGRACAGASDIAQWGDGCAATAAAWPCVGVDGCPIDRMGWSCGTVWRVVLNDRVWWDMRARGRRKFCPIWAWAWRAIAQLDGAVAAAAARAGGCGVRQRGVPGLQGIALPECAAITPRRGRVVVHRRTVWMVPHPSSNLEAAPQRRRVVRKWKKMVSRDVEKGPKPMPRSRDSERTRAKFEWYVPNIEIDAAWVPYKVHTNSKYTKNLGIALQICQYYQNHEFPTFKKPNLLQTQYLAPFDSYTSSTRILSTTKISKPHSKAAYTPKTWDFLLSKTPNLYQTSKSTPFGRHTSSTQILSTP
ncbi:hypothetical protein C8R45DRAFT_944347 [Mycena sanguinolenta]|nr:hypothetical protein C8R45DRAFT_944347 [Mycena sanguinolenta]